MSLQTYSIQVGRQYKRRFDSLTGRHAVQLAKKTEEATYFLVLNFLIPKINSSCRGLAYGGPIHGDAEKSLRAALGDWLELVAAPGVLLVAAPRVTRHLNGTVA